MKSIVTLAALALCGFGAFVSANAASATIRVVPEQSILKAGSEQRTVLKITVAADELPPAAERAPVNLALVIDTSGSMNGDRIENARLAALELISRLDRNDIFSLVTYDSEARTLVPAGPVEDRAALERIVRGLRARGMTALYGGVETAAEQLRRYQTSQYTHRMILISDGVANVGPSRPEQLAELGGKIGLRGVRISTIGLGLNYNEDLMTSLADGSGGNAYFAEGGPDLPRIIDREIGQALALAYESVTIEIQLPAGMRPVRPISRNVTLNHQNVNATLPPLYSGQTRDILIEVEVSADSAKNTLEIPEAHARMQRPGSKDFAEMRSKPVTIRFSENASDVDASVNLDVQAIRLRDEAALAREKALTMQSAGDRVGAAATLADTARRIQAAPAARENPALAADAFALEEQSKVMGTRELNRRERIDMRSQSFEQLNRQVVINE